MTEEQTPTPKTETVTSTEPETAPREAIASSAGSATLRSAEVTTSPPETTSDTPVYFDAVRHERVQRWKNKSGLHMSLGKQFGDLVFRQRPFSHPAVVAAQEAAEHRLLLDSGRKATDDLPADLQMEANKEAVIFTIMGCAGGVLVTEEEAARAASDLKLQVQEHDGRPVVQFDGDEDTADVRAFWGPRIQGPNGHAMFLRLIQNANEVTRLTDEKVDRLGKSFVHGRAEERDWHD